MKKILVTGNAGSGKSTVAKSMAEALNLPYHGLDKIVWKEHWQKATAKEQKKQIDKLIAQKSWVIDGVDYDIMKAADIVVFLDLSRPTCYRRAMKRNWKHLFKSRPELPDHCPEILIIPTLTKIIWQFPTRVRPKILEEKANRNTQSFIHIKSQVELESYLLFL